MHVLSEFVAITLALYQLPVGSKDMIKLVLEVFQYESAGEGLEIRATETSPRDAPHVAGTTFTR